MKKIGSIFLSIFLAFLSPVLVAHAAGGTVTSAHPYYDASFDNNKGAFYANGTAVIITADNGLTRISWTGGSIIVPSTIRVFGGGTAGSFYNESDITMLGGTVSHIYGGGFSTDPVQPAKVTKASIKITDGTVAASVYGGGLLYTEVDETTLLIENGTILSALGGGASSATIAGISYNTGTQEHPELSGTRVDTAKVIIRGGSISTVWGGGQGYSYTGDTTLNISGGTIEYITAGGSNGYTQSFSGKLEGGAVQVYQSTNRGIIKKVDFSVHAGSIETLYVGGETAPDVTGVVNEADIRILGGNVGQLRAGTSNAIPLDCTLPEYNVSFVTGTVAENDIAQGTESFSFTIKFSKNKYRIPQTKQLNTKLIVTTTPSGYESLLELDNTVYSSSDDTKVMINSEGTVIGLRNGDAQISAQLYDQTTSSLVEVRGIPVNYVLQIIFAVILGIVLVALLIIFTFLRKLFCLLFRIGMR